MILRHNLLEKYNKYSFKIPLNGRDKVLVEKGNKVSPGQAIYTKTGSTARYSFYIPDQLGCNLQNVKDCVVCIDGEFVNEGDVLAEKSAMGGLTVKTLVAPANGIVDLSRIRSGYVDILGEEQETTMKSSFNGEIEDVNPIDGITISASALALDLIGISNTEKHPVYGEFLVLNSGKDVKLRIGEEDCKDKIVFVGKHLHLGLLKDIFEKGAKFVLTYSMDYQDFRNQGLPVGIIGGFGEIYSGEAVLKTLEMLNGSFVVADFEEGQLFFVGDQHFANSKESVFVKSLVGSKIVSRALGNYGMHGEIVEAVDQGYATVEWEHKGRSVVSIGNLEFVNY